MKIKKIQWKDHPILKNLELDFTNNKGVPYETIIFAGENGTGKSTILDSISDFFASKNFTHFEYIEYTVMGKDYIAKRIKKDMNFYGEDSYAVWDGTQHLFYSFSPESNKDERSICYWGSAISRARADFKTEPIRGISAKELDKEKHDTDKKDSFTDIKQLLVDILTSDNNEFSKINKQAMENNAPELSYRDFYPSTKMYRFTKAFDDFFENKITFKGIDDKDDQKIILFTKDNNNIEIDSLSTGEKQIVFRGATLLKNSKILEDGIAMVDEPELSMHPKWQTRTLSYYKGLFTKKDLETEQDRQTVQLFITTHSEYVIQSAIADKKSIIICLNYKKGNIACKKINFSKYLPSITSAEINYLAFDMVSNDFHIALYGYIQEEEKKYKVKKCDEFIEFHSSYDNNKHEKNSSYTPKGGAQVNYNTLPTYIRNAIDHPQTSGTFTQEELRTSIELLTSICEDINKKKTL